MMQFLENKWKPRAGRTADRLALPASIAGAAVAALRVALLGTLVLWCLQDLPAARALAGLEALPDYDYAEAAERLRRQGRHDEALLVADAGLQQATVEQNAPAAATLLRQREALVADREAWRHRAGQLARGALTGEGETTEAISAAVVSDLFVFGDLRDLTLQGARGLRGEPVDTVLVGLSLAGIALTGNAAADSGTALLKLARRSGAISTAFGQQLLRLSRRAVRGRSTAPMMRVAGDAASLSRSMAPAVALRVLSGVQHSGQLATAARLAGKPGGAFALWVSGRPGLRWLGRGGTEGQALLLRAATKGPEGAEHLWRHARVLARPHPLVGALKGVYKGHVPELLQRFLRGHAPELLQRFLRGHAPELLGVLIAWLAFELGRLGLRLRRALPAARACYHTQPFPRCL